MSGAWDHLRPDEVGPLSTSEFASLAGLSEADVRELEEFKLLAPGDLDMRTALSLREAAKLRSDFDLDLFSTGLLAGYIRRVHDLEAQLQHQRAQSRAGAVYTEVTLTSVEVHRR